MLVEAPILNEDGRSANGWEWEPFVKITDFGLARQKEAEIQTQLMTAKMQTTLMTGCGTLYWMSPELLDGRKYNESVDVVSVPRVLRCCYHCVATAARQYCMLPNGHCVGW